MTTPDGSSWLSPLWKIISFSGSESPSSSPPKVKKRKPTCVSCRKHRNIIVRMKGHECPYRNKKEDENNDEIEKTVVIVYDDTSSSSEESIESIEPIEQSNILGKKRKRVERKESDESYEPDEDSTEDIPTTTPPPPRKLRRGNHKETPIIVDNSSITSSPTSNGENHNNNTSILKSVSPTRITIDDLSNLGSGSFGHVKKGTFDGSDVAIKIVYNKLREEAIFMQNLRHPNILQYYGVCLARQCLILELCDCDITTIMKSLNNIEVLKMIREIAHGIRYLHEENITHRDLKPANILVKSGTVKLADFGISKCIIESNNTRIGTPHYMAPEIFQGKYGNEIDIYAFGLIIYEMMSRKRLEDTIFKGLEAFGIAQKIREGAKPSIPRKWNSRVSRLLRQMFHQDPTKRPNIIEVEDALISIVETDFPSLKQVK